MRMGEGSLMFLGRHPVTRSGMSECTLASEGASSLNYSERAELAGLSKLYIECYIENKNLSAYAYDTRLDCTLSGVALQLAQGFYEPAQFL